MVKDFLRSVADAQHRIMELQERRERYLELATSVGGMSESNIRSTDKRSRVETAALALVDLSSEMEEQAERLALLVREAEGLIGKLTSRRHREVLTMRYIKLWSWRDIARHFGYTEMDAVYKLHGRALAEAERFHTDMLYLSSACQEKV